MNDQYESGFFSDEQVEHLFANAQQSMLRAHEETGPYLHIADYLRKSRNMRQPLCIQTFSLAETYDPAWAHIDVATALFPSITNLWFCATDCPGESFGFLEKKNNEELYAPFFKALGEKGLDNFEALCSPEHFDKYYSVKDYKKGDALFFDSRQVHRKMNPERRRTIVLKYIDVADLDDKQLYDYMRMPTGPDWVRALIFDRLRHMDALPDMQQYLRATEFLLNAPAEALPGVAAAPQAVKSWWRRLLSA
jgi:hypothetical protein